jgi:crotonobetainyl-CoA:carnitine CoA-transferase CaiB-like acyl-CoA transferase
MNPRRLARKKTARNSAGLPLEGVRVLAVSQFGAGPYSTMILAELGAEVIKVEDPSTGGDVSRSVPPYAIEHDSLYFQSFNRNKKSFTLDLKTREGRQIFDKLVGISHAVLNNVRGDQVRKLGLNYTSLKRVNPKIVCCSLSGFGTAGPHAAEPGYDYLMQARAGYMSLTGDPHAPPATCGVSVIDHAAGFAAALGLTAAVFAANKTGRGRDVGINLISTAFSMLSYLAIWNLNRGYEPMRHPGSAHQSLVPVQTFRTKDSYLVVFCAKDHFWQKLCRILRLQFLLRDERFTSFAKRLQNREALLPLLEKKLLARTTNEWLELLRGNVPCAPVNTLSQAMRELPLLDSQILIETEHPSFGTVRQIASPISFPGVSRRHRRAPALGEHTDDILRQYLGYNQATIGELRRKKII